MARDIVTEYQKALGSGDFEAARKMLHDDLQFKGPFEELSGADDYQEAIRRLWGIVESIDIRHISSSDGETVVLYDMVTNTPAGSQLICEWYGIEGEKISWIRAVFDTAPFAFLRSGT
jgi:hypothetical protein